MRCLREARQQLRDMVYERERCGTCGNQKHAGRDDCWYCCARAAQDDR